MSRLRLLFAIFAATLLLAACENPRRRAEKILRSTDLPTLRRDAGVAIKNHFASRGRTVVSLSSDSWPPSIKPFHPTRVYAYPDGVAVILEASGTTESGLYILPDGLTNPPSPTPRTRYTPLKEGIYWCEIGGSEA